MNIRLILKLAAMAAFLPAPALPDGLYTARQAATGEADYAQFCASCHGARLEGISGPALAGPAFATSSDHYTLGQIFDVLLTGTPAGAPGSLTARQYTDIMAFLLARNGYRPGATSLTYTAARRSKAPFFSQP